MTEWKKSRVFWMIALIELLLVVFSFCGIFAKKTYVEIDVNGAVQLLGSKDTNDIYFVDESCGNKGVFLQLNNIALSRGTYKVKLDYMSTSDGFNQYGLESTDIAYGNLKSSGGRLYSYETIGESDFWLYEDTETLTFNISYCGMGELAVMGLSFQETSAMSLRSFVIVLFLSLLIDAIYMYCIYNKQHEVAGNNKAISFALGVIVILASIPMMTNYIPYASQVNENLARIEAIARSLGQWKIPVKLLPEWQYAFQSTGYSSDLLYSIPAMFRNLGFDLQFCYKLFVWFINIGTCIVSYYVFKEISKDRMIGVLCSLLYTLSIFRIYRLYCVGALEEAAALMFLPLVLYMCYLWYAQEDRKKKKKGWLFGLIGLTGLLHTYPLLLGIVCLFVFLTAFLLFKRTFTKEILQNIGKLVLVFGMINAWFLVAFLQYWKGNRLIIPVASTENGMIQEAGLFLNQLFFSFFKNGTNMQKGAIAESAVNPAGLGVVLLGAMMTFLVIVWMRVYSEEKKRIVNIGKMAVLLAIISMTFSLKLFPWDTLQERGETFKNVIGWMQTPIKFLAITTVLLVLVAGIVAVMLKEKQNSTAYWIYLLSMIIISIVTGMYLMNDLMLSTGMITIYNGECLETDYRLFLQGKSSYLDIVLEIMAVIGIIVAVVWGRRDASYARNEE